MTISNVYLVLATCAMAGVTLLIRMTPTVLPKKLLDSPLLQAVNKGLPLSVMTLLILSSLSWQNATKQLAISPLLIAQVISIIIVLLSYHWWKQLFVSMLIGIASLNGCLWLLHYLAIS